MPEVLDGKLRQAAFFSRHDRAKDALDILEPLWANPRDIKAVAPVCIGVLLGTKSTNARDPVQLNRVGGWFDRALAQPQNDRATKSLLLWLLGNFHERQKSYQEAETEYRRAIKEDAGNAVAYNNLAWLMALSTDSKLPEALQDINRALVLKPGHPEFLDTRGIIYLKLSNIQNAINDLTKAVAIDPAPPKLFHLAQAYLANKDKQKAKEKLETARTKGLTRSGLHALEQPAYEKIVGELAAP